MWAWHEPARAAQVAAGCNGAVAAGNGDLVSSPLTERRGRARCEEPGVDGGSSTTGRSWR